MKITMYELLGLVKDGKAPKKIKYRDEIYEYQHRRDSENCFNYMCNENGKYLSEKYFIDNILNDKVEILEEEKKIPEKIPEIVFLSNHSHRWTEEEKVIVRTVNEIIDYLHYLKSKGDE